MTTSSIAYLTALEFRRNSKFVSTELKEAQSVIDNHGKTSVQVLQPLEYETRVNLTETMKDVWNDEIIKGVNWVYGIQWNSIAKRVENGAETAAGYVKSSIQ